MFVKLALALPKKNSELLRTKYGEQYVYDNEKGT